MSSNTNYTTITSSTTATTSTTTVSGSNSTIIREETNSINFNEFRSKALKRAMSNNNSTSGFNIHDNSSLLDEEFKELKEYILLESYGNNMKYSTICAARLSDLEREQEELNVDVRKKLYSAVILDNKSKILNILRNEFDQTSITNADSLMVQLRIHLIQLADELMECSEYFELNVINKISINRVSNESLVELQTFIKSILNDRNEPNLREIGNNENLKKKYIKLAVFLLNFRGLEQNSSERNGISECVMRHITRIVELRHKIVVTLSRWMEYLIREMFGYLFGLEGRQVDQSFISSISIEYGLSEKVLTEMRTNYENQLRIKNDRIAVLENELADSREQVVESSSNEDSELVSKLNEQIEFLNRKLETTSQQHTLIVKEIYSKNELALSDLTKRYDAQLLELRNQINNSQSSHTKETTVIRETITTEITRKYETVINQLKDEYEKKILNLTIANDALMKKYTQMESTYNTKITTLINEKSQMQVPSNTIITIWSGSETQTEKEETIKYVDRDLPVPVAPRVVEVERLVSNVVEVKVRKIKTI